MDKSQTKKMALQLSFLAVLLIAIFFMLSGGFSGGGSENNTPDSTAQKLDLPEVPDIPESFSGTLESVEQELSRRNIKNIELNEFDGPNRSIFRPAN